MNAGLYTIVAGPDRNVWFTESLANKIGRIKADGEITEFSVPSAETGPWGIAAGPDGNLWFTETGANKIGRITPGGAITEFPIPTASSIPGDIALGPDGNLWFAERGANAVGKITISGMITEFSLPSCSGCGSIFPGGVTSGSDGNIWVTIENSSSNGGQIARITPTGTITEYSGVAASCCYPDAITSGPDGNLWYTEIGPSQIGRMTTSGISTQIPLPTANRIGFVRGIAAGPDGHIWFAGQLQSFTCAPFPHCHYYFNGSIIYRVTTTGSVTQFALPNPASNPQFVTSGPVGTGTMWITEDRSNKIGEFRP